MSKNDFFADCCHSSLQAYSHRAMNFQLAILFTNKSVDISAERRSKSQNALDHN